MRPAADIDAVESLAREADPNHVRLPAAEVTLVRRLLTAQGRSMRRAVLSILGDTIGEVPGAAAA